MADEIIPAHTMPVFAQVLLALVTVIASTRAMGWVFRRMAQPSVVGELVAGLLLGPSFFGWLAPELQAVVLPAGAIPALTTLAELSVVAFMFLVGIELDVAALAHQARAALVIASASVVVPFALGLALATALFPDFAGPGASFAVFGLFVAVSMSVTAFPVLARILTDFGLQRTALGRLALTSAAASDVAAWCLLAIITGLAKAQPSAGVLTVGLTVVFVAVMFVVARPAIVRMAANDSFGPWLLLAAAAGAAWGTQAIGIHALFGAFLVGVLVPHESASATILDRRLTQGVGLLLPTFFAVTGLRTSLSLITGGSAWVVSAAVLLVACLGKFGGGYLAARFARLSGRDSVAIGALMNTRGLVELVVLNIGLQLGVISPSLFAMLVLMALVTTAMTTPVLLVLGFRPEAKPGR